METFICSATRLVLHLLLLLFGASANAGNFIGGGFLFFEPGNVTTNTTEVISGAASIKGSYFGTDPVNAYLLTNSSVLRLAPSQTYQVTYKYRILTTPTKNFDVIFLSPTAWAAGAFSSPYRLSGVVGDTGTATFTTTLGPYTDYEARWEILGTGAIAIDDIQIVNVTTGQVVASENAERTTQVTFNLTAGWNLLGNSSDQVLTVSSPTIFGDAGRVTSVWMWDATNGIWLFYSPEMSIADLYSYASSKGYRVLGQISPGDGFWVNAKTPSTVAINNSSRSATPAIATGWNLITTGSDVSPSAFVSSQTTSDITSIWAWDSSTAQWFFYAPTLDVQGTLNSFIASNGYLGFGDSGKTLGDGVGFWVNAVAKPTDPACDYAKPSVISYPPGYNGVFPMPTPAGRLPGSVVRTMAFLDGTPTDPWRYPPPNSLCTDQNLYGRSLWKETLNRIQQDGATRVWIYNWSGFDDFSKPNWGLSKSPAISDSNFQFIVAEARKRNLEVFYSHQFDFVDLHGNTLSPALTWDTLIKLMTKEEFRRTLDAWHLFIVGQARLAQQIGVAGMQVDWAYPGLTQIIQGQPNYDPEFRTMYLNEMSLIIDDIRAVFTGKLEIGAIGVPSLDSKIAAKIDAISFTLGIGITAEENNNLTVDLLKKKYKALIQQQYSEVFAQIGSTASSLPVIWRVQVQSKYDYYVTGWTESVICVGNPCIQRTYTTDFSVQAIGTEAVLEAINEQTYFKSDSLIIDAGYWFNDEMVPRADGQTGFSNLHQTVRNKPAENIVKYWFGR